LAAHVDSEIGDPWESEEIPDEDVLYLRVHRLRLKKRSGAIGVSSFQEMGEGTDRGMSTDWCKYSTPLQTRQRAENSRPEDSFVVALRASDIRAISGLTVTHTPDVVRENRAHTDVRGVRGENVLEIESKLRDACWVVLPLED